jgi:hypothetical protein
VSHTRKFDDHHLPTYSNLLEWLKQHSTQSAPTSQWIATIRNARDFREEEVERSGLLAALDACAPDGKISKTDLLAIAGKKLSVCRPVLLTERMVAYRPDLQIEAFDPALVPKRVLESFANSKIIRTCELSSFGYKIIGVTFNDMFGIGTGWFVFDNRWRLIPPPRGYMSSLDAIDAAYNAVRGKFSGYVSPTARNFYERYSLFGKRQRYREWLVWLKNAHNTFLNEHFSIENIVLHIRTSVWNTNGNAPILLVDEIQSDWHARGKESGYSEGDGDEDAVPDVPYKKEWHELGIKIAIWIAIRSGITQIAFTTGDQHCERWGELEGLRLLYDRQIPKSLSKLASKFNCGMEWKGIPVRKPRQTIRYRKGLGWEISERDKKLRPKVVLNEAVALRYWQAGADERIENVRVLNISKELITTIKAKGVPLFGWWEAP